jgi:hypothetical protein
MKRLIICFALFAMVLVGCATSRLATPSGRPEVFIASTDRQAIKSVIIEFFSSKGYALSSETENALNFIGQMDMGSTIVYKTLLGSPYSSDPEWEINLVFTSIGDGTKVYANAFTTMQSAFGRTDRQDMTSGKSGNQLQSFLENVKHYIETGEPIQMSASGDSSPSSGSKPGKIGVQIGNQIVYGITPSGPAELAGLKVGDKVISANGVPLTGDNSHDVGLISGDPGTTVTLQVLRRDEELEISIVRGQ